MLVLLRCRPMNPPPPAPEIVGTKLTKKFDGESYRILGPKQNIAWIPMIFSTCVRLNRYLRICLLWFLTKITSNSASYFPFLRCCKFDGCKFSASQPPTAGDLALHWALPPRAISLGAWHSAVAPTMAVLQLDSNLRAGNEEGHNSFLGLMSRILTPLKIRNQQIFKHLGDLLKNV